MTVEDLPLYISEPVQSRHYHAIYITVQHMDKVYTRFASMTYVQGLGTQTLEMGCGFRVGLLWVPW